MHPLNIYQQYFMIVILISMNSQCLQLDSSEVIKLHPGIAYQQQFKFDRTTDIQSMVVIEASSLMNVGWDIVNIEIRLEQGETINSCSGVNSVSCQILPLSQGKSFMIQISSSKKGRYSLRSYINKYSQIKSQQNTLNLQNQAQYLFIALQNIQIEELRIQIIPSDSNLNPTLQLLKQNSYKKQVGANLWYGRRALFISNSDLNNQWVNMQGKIYFKIGGGSNQQILVKYQILKQNHHNLEIPQDIDQYISPSQTKLYHLEIPTLSNDENLVISIYQYQGILGLQFFKDQQMNIKYKAKSVAYRGDSKIIFTKQQIQANSIIQLYLRGQTNDQPSIFRMLVQIQSTNYIAKLQEFSYNFIPILKQQTKKVYIQISKTQLDNFGEEISAQVAITSSVGIPEINLYTKKIGSLKQVLECVPDCPDKTERIGSVKSYSIGLKNMYRFKLSNKNKQQIIVIISIKNQNQRKQKEQLIVQYQLKEKIKIIKQKQPIQYEVMNGQTIIYKFIPFQSYKNVKMCYLQITNDIGVMGTDQNPFQEDANWRTPNFSDNCVYFQSPQANKPLFLSVYGKDRAKYVVYVHIQQISSLLQTEELKLIQNIEFQIKIPPLQGYIFQTQAVKNIQISYNSSIPLQICLQGSIKYQCDEQTAFKNSKSGFIQKQFDSEQKRLILTKNPSIYETISLVIKYRSSKVSECPTKRIGTLYQQEFSAGVICLQYKLPNAQEMKILYESQKFPISFFSKSLHINRLQINISVCNHELIEGNTGQTIYIKHQMLYGCYQDTLQQIVFQPTLKIMIENPSEQGFHKLQYLLDYQSDILILPADIVYEEKRIVKPGKALRNYIYSNMLSISKFTYVTIKDYSNFPLRLSTFLDTNNHTVPLTWKQVQKMQYNWMIQTTEIQKSKIIFIQNSSSLCQQLQQKNSNSSQCILVIVVQAIEDVKNIGETVVFDIQIRHQDKIIKQFSPLRSSIDVADDTDVYRYYPSLNSDITSFNQSSLAAMVKLSTGNSQCGLLTIFTQNSTLLDPEIKGSEYIQFINSVNLSSYIIQVQSVLPSCHYTLELITYFEGTSEKSHNHIFGYINANHQTDLSIEPQQIQYFIVNFQEIVTNQTKIGRVIFMKKFGNVHLYATQGTQQNLRKIFNHDGYDFSEADFPYFQEFPDILSIQHTHQTSTFILAVLTLQNSEGTLMTYSSHGQIKLPMTQSLLLPINNRQDVSIYYYYYDAQIQKIHLNLLLFYGEIAMKTALVDQKGKIFPLERIDCCIVNKDNQITIQIKDIVQKQKRTSNFRYILIKVEGLDQQNSLINIQMHPQKSQLDFYSIKDFQHLRGLNLGVSQVLSIKTIVFSKQSNIMIVIDQIDGSSNIGNFIHQYQLNTTYQYRNVFQCIQVEVRRQDNSQLIQIQQFIIQDMVLQLQIDFANNTQDHSKIGLYIRIQLISQCELDNISLSITSDLSGKISILEPWKWVATEHINQFIITGFTEYLLDFSICSDQFDISIEQNYSELSNFQSNNSLLSKEQFAYSNLPYVYKISKNSQISYLRVKSPKAVFRLIVPDYEKQIGIGYFKYQWMGFQYTISSNSITLHFKNLTNISATQTKVISRLHHIQIITDIVLTQYQLKCDQVSNKIIDILVSDKNDKYQIKKDVLLKKMGTAKNIYVRIDETVLINSPANPQIQIYKFKGPLKQIPKDVFIEQQIQKFEVYKPVIAMVLFFIFILGIGCLTMKVIVPWISRRKVNFAQEQKQRPSTQMEQVPASSDRNTRQNNLNSDRKNQPQTQQNMVNK